MCNISRGTEARTSSDPYRASRRADCLSRLIIIPTSIDLLNSEVLSWMHLCVISRTTDESGIPRHTELYLVQNSNLSLLWNSILQYYQGQQAQICVEYIFYGRGLEIENRLEFTTNLNPPRNQELTNVSLPRQPEHLIETQRLISGRVLPNSPVGDIVVQVRFRFRILNYSQQLPPPIPPGIDLRVQLFCIVDAPTITLLGDSQTVHSTRIRAQIDDMGVRWQAHYQTSISERIRLRFEVGLAEIRDLNFTSMTDFIDSINRAFTTVFQLRDVLGDPYHNLNISFIARGINEFGTRADLDHIPRIQVTFETIQITFRVFFRLESTVRFSPAFIARTAVQGARTASTISRVAAALPLVEIGIGVGIIGTIIAANVATFEFIRRSVEEGERRGLWNQFSRGYVLFIIYPNQRERWFGTDVRDPGSERITNNRQMARILGLDSASRDAQRDGILEVRRNIIRQYLPRLLEDRELDIPLSETTTIIDRMTQENIRSGRHPLDYERF